MKSPHEEGAICPLSTKIFILLQYLACCKTQGKHLLLRAKSAPEQAGEGGCWEAVRRLGPAAGSALPAARPALPGSFQSTISNETGLQSFVQINNQLHDEQTEREDGWIPCLDICLVPLQFGVFLFLQRTH